MDPEAVADWFEKHRGIRRETLTAFKLGSNGTNVTFPYPNGVKERPDPTQELDGRRRFYFTAGISPALFHSPPTDAPSHEVAYLVEGETDTMRLWQELAAENPGGDDVQVYGIGGIHTWRPELANELTQYQRVFVILDNDQDYNVRAQVDAAWKQIRHDLGGRAKRIELPGDVKDICEFFDRYDYETLTLLSEKRTQSRYTPINFLQPPPPVRWLVESWIAMGDVTLLAGAGGLGKSFWAMGLAMAMLRGDPEFLGKPLHEHGRVLIVDEENPLDVVYQRMLRLGLNAASQSGNLRYLWNQAVRLDRDPDALLDEAMEFQPKLIVLDSLTRIHGEEEKDAGAMAPLFNDGIKPLAREVGAAVIVIHHHDKNATGPRGSTDIFNSADAVLEAYDRGAASPDKFLLRVTKSRRAKKGAEMVVGIKDTDGGGIRLEADAPLELQF